MELIINHERTIRNPDAEAIAEQLRGLGPGEFAILSPNELTFIQTMNTDDEGFVVEYQDGSTEEHYAALNPPHEVEDIVAAFVAYAAGEDDWKTIFTWEQMLLTPADFCLVSVMAPGYLDRNESTIEAEDHMELPEFGPHSIVELAALLLGQTADEAVNSFEVVAEIEPDGMDPPQVIPFPAEFQLALSKIVDGQATKLAKQWAATESFHDPEIDITELAEVLMELTTLAKLANQTDRMLVISYFADQQLGE